jgi:hypothetical protein
MPQSSDIPSKAYDERVCTGLKCGKTRANNEHGTTEATKRPLDTTGPEEKSTDTIDAETGDESPAVSKLANNPTTVCERTDEVSSEICTVAVSDWVTRRLRVRTLEDQMTAQQ